MGVMSKVGKIVSPTAVALGMTTASEDAEAAHIPLKAFFESGSDTAKALYKKAKKAISDGMSEDELYQTYAVRKSEDGDYKVDVPELKARDREHALALDTFRTRALKLMAKQKGGSTSMGTMEEYLPPNSPVFDYFPDLKNTKVKIQTASVKKPGLLGEYDPETQEVIVYVPSTNAADAPVSEDKALERARQAFGTLVHEFQHHIQNVKGLTTRGGSNTVVGRDNIRNLQEQRRSLQLRQEFLESQWSGGFVKGLSRDELQKEMQNTMSSLATIDEMLSSASPSRAIYLRQIGEAEARGAALTWNLLEDERKAIGVFYPADSVKAGKTAAETKQIISETPELDKDMVLVRLEDPSMYPAAKNSDYPSSQMTPARSEDAKKGKGLADLPSNAIATGIAGLFGYNMDKARRGSEVSEEDAQEFASGFPMYSAEDTEFDESSLVPEVPVVSEVVMAADLLGAVSNMSQMEEGEEQPEAVDEFSGVEFNEGGLMDNKPKRSYNQAGLTTFEMIPSLVTGTDEDVTDAALISREYASQQGFDDEDRTEDTMRHVLLGGLVYGDPEGDRNIGNKAASAMIDWREGQDPESMNDLANNEYGRKLRTLFPDREEFIEMVKILANGMYSGEEMPDIEGAKPNMSYGNSKPTQTKAEDIMSDPQVEGIMSEEKE